MSELEKRKEAALERLKHAWVRGVVAGLADVDEDIAKKVLEKCGEACARSYIASRGYDQASHDLDSWIKLLNESRPNVYNVQKKDGEVLYELKMGRCVCWLVSENVIALNPRLCSACATNFYKYTFQNVAKRPVRVEVVESHATGANKCVFRIRLQ